MNSLFNLHGMGGKTINNQSSINKVQRISMVQ